MNGTEETWHEQQQISLNKINSSKNRLLKIKVISEHGPAFILYMNLLQL